MAWKFDKAPAAAGAAQPAPTPALSAAVAPPASAPAAAGVMPTFPNTGAAAAAPLPAVAAAASPTPTPAAAAAPKRGRPRAAAAASAPVAQVPGQQTLAAAGAPLTPAAAPTTPMPVTQYSGFLGVIIPAAPVKSTLQVMIEGRTAPGEPNIFPTVELVGGNTGGMLDNSEMNQEGDNADLPIGRNAIVGILLGYRTLITAWPQAFKEGQAKSRPRWQGSFPLHETQIGDLVQSACQKYTFRNRENNAMYDQAGHPSIILELMIFEPKVGLMCIRTTGTYDSAIETGATVHSAFPGGQVQPVPVKITPRTEPRSSKTRQWNEHFLVVQQHLGTPETQAAMDAFNAFYGQAGADPDLGAAMQEWNKQSLTQDMLNALEAITQI